MDIAIRRGGAAAGIALTGTLCVEFLLSRRRAVQDTTPSPPPVNYDSSINALSIRDTKTALALLHEPFHITPSEVSAPLPGHCIPVEPLALVSIFFFLAGLSLSVVAASALPNILWPVDRPHTTRRSIFSACMWASLLLLLPILAQVPNQPAAPKGSAELFEALADIILDVKTICELGWILLWLGVPRGLLTFFPNMHANPPQLAPENSQPPPQASTETPNPLLTAPETSQTSPQAPTETPNPPPPPPPPPPPQSPSKTQVKTSTETRHQSTQTASPKRSCDQSTQTSPSETASKMLGPEKHPVDQIEIDGAIYTYDDVRKLLDARELTVEERMELETLRDQSNDFEKELIESEALTEQTQIKLYNAGQVLEETKEKLRNAVYDATKSGTARRRLTEENKALERELRIKKVEAAEQRVQSARLVESATEGSRRDHAITQEHLTEAQASVKTLSFELSVLRKKLMSPSLARKHRDERDRAALLDRDNRRLQQRIVDRDDQIKLLADQLSRLKEEEQVQQAAAEKALAGERELAESYLLAANNARSERQRSRSEAQLTELGLKAQIDALQARNEALEEQQRLHLAKQARVKTVTETSEGDVAALRSQLTEAQEQRSRAEQSLHELQQEHSSCIRPTIVEVDSDVESVTELFDAWQPFVSDGDEWWQTTSQAVQMEPFPEAYASVLAPSVEQAAVVPAIVGTDPDTCIPDAHEEQVAGDETVGSLGGQQPDPIDDLDLDFLMDMSDDAFERMIDPSSGLEQVLDPALVSGQTLDPSSGPEQVLDPALGSGQMIDPSSELEQVLAPALTFEQLLDPSLLYSGFESEFELATPPREDWHDFMS